MLKPKRAQKNGNVSLFHPSDPLVEDRILKINRGIETIRKWGFEVEKPGSNTLGKWALYRTPQDRAAEIHDLLSDDSVDILLATWGGKICLDLLPFLDFQLISDAAKPILGVSDIGVLLNAIAFRSNLITFYGPNIAGKLYESEEKGFPLITSPPKELLGNYLLSKETSSVVVRSGIGEGRLIGGSIGTFTIGLSGTPYFPHFDEVILFLESGSLNNLTIRQHLKKLFLSSSLANVVGIVIGALTQLETEKEFETFDRFLLELFDDASIPILRGNFFGHGIFPNLTLPVGANVRLSTDIKNLILLEPICE